MNAPVPGPDPREQALELARQREFARALAVLEPALADSLGSDERAEAAATLGAVARAAEAASDLESAQHALERAARLVDWADLHCQLGSVLVRRGRRAEARAAFERALAVNPRYRNAAVERALLDARDGRIAEAMETLRVLAADGTLAEPGAFQQGMERLGHADFEEAAPLLRRALAQSDAWLEAELRLYQEHVAAGDGARALAVLRAAALERPGYADLQLLLGTHELQMGAVDDAIESLAQALELNPSFHGARVELARAFEALGDTTQALAQLELVLDVDALHAQARALHERLSARRRGGRTTPVA